MTKKVIERDFQREGMEDDIHDIQLEMAEAKGYNRAKDEERKTWRYICISSTTTFMSCLYALGQWTYSNLTGLEKAFAAFYAFRKGTGNE